MKIAAYWKTESSVLKEGKRKRGVHVLNELLFRTAQAATGKDPSFSTGGEDSPPSPPPDAR